eukprot:7165293-Lingulodinium_polyedra.AAC.1
MGATVFIEWPRSCEYWKGEGVVRTMTRYGFRYAEFDGFMYGLQPLSQRCQRARICKPWRIAC